MALSCLSASERSFLYLVSSGLSTFANFSDFSTFSILEGEASVGGGGVAGDSVVVAIMLQSNQRCKGTMQEDDRMSLYYPCDAMRDGCQRRRKEIDDEVMKGGTEKFRKGFCKAKRWPGLKWVQL
jgi:hypothetical protein